MALLSWDKLIDSITLEYGSAEFGMVWNTYYFAYQYVRPEHTLGIRNFAPPASDWETSVINDNFTSADASAFWGFYERHRPTWSAPPPPTYFVCEICGAGYATATELEEHKRIAHPPVAPTEADVTIYNSADDTAVTFDAASVPCPSGSSVSIRVAIGTTLTIANPDLIFRQTGTNQATITADTHLSIESKPPPPPLPEEPIPVYVAISNSTMMDVQVDPVGTIKSGTVGEFTLMSGTVLTVLTADCYFRESRIAMPTGTVADWQKAVVKRKPTFLVAETELTTEEQEARGKALPTAGAGGLLLILLLLMAGKK